MEYFLISLTSVGVMLLYAVPGFATVKAKMIKPESIPAFATVLMYVCQPCLTFHSSENAEFTWPLFGQMAIFFALAFVLQAVVLGAFYLVFRKKSQDVKYRVCTVACAFGNCAFMGVPLLEAMFPDNQTVVLFSVMFLLGMNLLGWTIASAIITRDKKYISVKKALFNPALIGFLVALPFFFTHTRLPGALSDIVMLLGKMTTPMCMLVMGMRLATIRMKSLFGSPLQYFAVFIKQIVFPLIGLLLVWFLPFFDRTAKETMVILCCTPVASVVLNFAEMLGEGQETAANTVLLGTAGSVVTIPLMMLLMTAI